jgi:hypothetical protein
VVRVNVVDEIELAYLEFTGSLEVAEWAGRIVREHFEAMAYLFGLSVDELFTYLDTP